MAATDYKITSAEIRAVHVEAQPTVLQGTPLQNKKVFDAYSDMIVSHFNNLCDFAETDAESTEIAESVLTLYQSLGWEQD